MMARVLGAGLFAALCAGGTAHSQSSPKVVRTSPARGAVDVDAASVGEIVVEFDRDMSRKAYSWCGGGPTFPKIPAGKRPFWRTARACVLPVVLEPDHTYRFSVNCASSQSFVSAGGVPAAPYPVSFTTRPAKPLSRAEQTAQNEEALDELMDVLASKYSYYDRRVDDWDMLLQRHRAGIVRATSRDDWARKTAAMLAAAEDVHLYFQVGTAGAVVATAERRVDPLYRARNLKRYVRDLEPLGQAALVGRTGRKDRIGYLMVGSWTTGLDLDAVERALDAMRETVDAVVVDVRPNAGGDERRAQKVAAWFLPERRVVYAKSRSRQKAGDDGFGPMIERKLAGYGGGRRLDVPVAVLTSRYVMSSCEGFVLMMRQAPDCTVVGQPTYGSSGNPKAHSLNNGVTVVVPSWQACRPDGSCFEGEGLKPHVPVDAKPEVLDRGVDPILAEAIEVLERKLAGRR